MHIAEGVSGSKLKERKEMKKTKISITILLIALTAMMIVDLPMTQAQTMYNSGNYLKLPTEIPTFIYCWASPDPVGVGQTAYVNAIFSKPVPTSHGLLGDMYVSITIEITDPDGQKLFMDHTMVA